MHNSELQIMPGDRVAVFDATLFRDDVTTPPSVTVRPATVVRRYGTWSSYTDQRYHYPDLIDVVFDDRPQTVSRGHFTDCVMVL